MRPRDPEEAHRPATPLELLYDLCFVVAIAQAAAALHHSILGGHALAGLLSFVQIFFAIWWAWMGFAWFASAFDTDDAVYRLKVFVQMCGVLILAAGVPSAFEHQDYRLIAIGYLVMRLGLVAQWLRAARNSAELRPACLRYIVGIVGLQAAWVGLVFTSPGWIILGWIALVLLEVAVPVWAESAAATPWHRRHIAERYGLLTIIVIGESVLAVTIAVQSVLQAGDELGSLLQVVAGAALTLFSMWWLYFARDHEGLLTSKSGAFLWGYLHYLVFASSAAVGAGFAVCADVAVGHGAMEPSWAVWAAGIPLVVFLASLWAVMYRHGPRALSTGFAFGLASVLILAGPVLTTSPLLPGVVAAALTGTVVLRSR